MAKFYKLVGGKVVAQVDAPDRWTAEERLGGEGRVVSAASHAISQQVKVAKPPMDTRRSKCTDCKDRLAVRGEPKCRMCRDAGQPTKRRWDQRYPEKRNEAQRRYRAGLSEELRKADVLRQRHTSRARYAAKHPNAKPRKGRWLSDDEFKTL